MIKRTVDAGRKFSRSNRMLIDSAANEGINIKKIPVEKLIFRMDDGNKKYLIRH